MEREKEERDEGGRVQREVGGGETDRKVRREEDREAEGESETETETETD